MIYTNIILPYVYESVCAMSEATTPLNPIDQLIEKFGGLRPMAKALNVPVPTVQGWKKRGRVPAEHHAALQSHAALQGWSADLAFLLLGDTKTTTHTQKSIQEGIQQPQPTTAPRVAATQPVNPAYVSAMLGTPQQGSHYWVWLGLASVAGVIATFLILLVLFFAPNLGAWLWPKNAAHTAADTPAQQWLARLDTLETQLEALNDNDHARAKALESLQKARMELTTNNPDAASSVKDLQKQIQALQGQIEQLNKQKQAAGLLEKMAARDTRAATLLLATTKLQQIFQGNGAFAETLPQLHALLADYPQLQAALAKLAPYAETGLPKSSHIQADIRRQAVAYNQAQQQPADAEQPSWLAKIGQMSEQFVTIKKNDQTLVGGNAAALPPAVPEALEALEQNDYAQTLQKLRSLPQAWQTALAPSIKDTEGRLAAQKLLNQLWQASAKLVK